MWPVVRNRCRSQRYLECAACSVRAWVVATAKWILRQAVYCFGRMSPVIQTDTRVEVGAAQSEPIVARCSPEGVEDERHLARAPHLPCRDELAMAALLESQLLVIKTYCTLAKQGLILLNNESYQTACTCSDATVYHPIQDPFGTLSLALSVVRRNPPTPSGHGVQRFRSGCTIACAATKLQLSAVLCVAQKMSAHSLQFRYEDFVQHVVGLLFTHEEVPKTAYQWLALVRAHRLLEVRVLDEPLLRLWTDSLVIRSEAILWDLHQQGRIARASVEAGRGCTFFFVGACWLNPEARVLENIEQRVGRRVAARGCAMLVLHLLVACGATASADEVDLVRNTDVDEKSVVATMLDNGIANHSQPLRVGPYRVPDPRHTTLHVVQNLLDLDNIVRARTLLR